ncbi:ROK family glucokinase [Arsenicicoccus sp. oral taxon 190]|uniref:ROK family glucokinase n=1 Tax=Arsenicicoccus sp. oral taxon 190 TaxID=1658671 RepID=UPI00067A0156|nr:ROK family glucokinase [Arsenicicoccus sp. oral taxon 190]AKT52045.1 glucokinase [Arsenicicoccus sp. oral taxon 190]
MSDLAIGIDIGGTKVAGGVLDDTGTIVHRARRDTPHRSKSPAVVEDTIVAVIDDLLAEVPGGSVAAVGIGAAGWVSVDRATVLFAPHLSWRHEPLRERLASRVAAPVYVDNDANAAGWAEHRFGAGQDESHLMMITLGTGIGGALVTDGRVQRGRYGVAGEYGHMMVVPGGHRCECGNRGCWEQYASGNALVREARSLLLANSPLAHDLLARLGGEEDTLTGPMITEAAQDGDQTCVELIADIGRWLGTGLANLAAAFDPGTFVIGGGVSAAGDLLLQPARETFARELTGRGYRPMARIVQARLGNEAGLIGAADLARTAVRAGAPDGSGAG